MNCNVPNKGRLKREVDGVCDRVVREGGAFEGKRIGRKNSSAQEKCSASLCFNAVVDGGWAERHCVRRQQHLGTTDVQLSSLPVPRNVVQGQSRDWTSSSLVFDAASERTGG